MAEGDAVFTVSGNNVLVLPAEIKRSIQCRRGCRWARTSCSVLREAVLLGQNVCDSEGPGRAAPVFPADGRIRRELRRVCFSEVLSQPSDKLSK